MRNNFKQPLGSFGRLGLDGYAQNKGVGDIIRSIFADGTDGFYFNFSKTDRLFQDTAGGTPANDAGENIALALESHAWGGAASYAAMIAAQADVLTNGSFDDGATGWSVTGTDGTHIVTFSGGSMRYQSDTTSPTLSLTQANALVVGRFYEVETVCTAYVSGTIKIDDAFGATTIADALGTKRTIIKATATTLTIVRRTANVDLTLDSIKIRPLFGNHGVQTTAAAQPKWQTGGLARFDGSDDNLLTTLVASNTGMTLLAKAKLAATGGTRGVMGVNGADGVSRCFLAFDVSGYAAGGAGSDSLSVIKGSVNRSGAYCVLGITVDASNWRLYEQGVQTNTGAKNGSCNTTLGIPLGGLNANGTLGTFANIDLTHALAIKKALTAAEIAAITNLWGTT